MPERNKVADQSYAEKVLASFTEREALVPDLWHLEASNVLLGAEKHSGLSVGEIEGFISQLEDLPIHVDPLTSHQAFSRTMALGRAYTLSSYDAAYLELAIRKGTPLATLDKYLVKAAKKVGVEIYLK